jgi:guanylate kinase
VERVLGSGRHAIMDIDVRGAQQFVQAFPDAVLIFVLPPNAEVLLTRLTARKTEDRKSLIVRLQTALLELQSVGMYKFVVVNDDLESAVDRVSAIIDAEASRADRVRTLEQQVAELIVQLEREIDKRSNP